MGHSRRLCEKKRREKKVLNIYADYLTSLQRKLCAFSVIGNSEETELPSNLLEGLSNGIIGICCCYFGPLNTVPSLIYGKTLSPFYISVTSSIGQLVSITVKTQGCNVVKPRPGASISQKMCTVSVISKDTLNNILYQLVKSMSSSG